MQTDKRDQASISVAKLCRSPRLSVNFGWQVASRFPVSTAAACFCGRHHCASLIDAFFFRNLVSQLWLCKISVAGADPVAVKLDRIGQPPPLPFTPRCALLSKIGPTRTSRRVAVHRTFETLEPSGQVYATEISRSPTLSPDMTRYSRLLTDHRDAAGGV